LEESEGFLMGSAGILPAECGILPHHFSCTFTRTKRSRQHAGNGGQHTRAPLRACPTKICLALRHRIHFEQKNAVGQALRLPQFFDGSSSSGSVWLRWERPVIYFITICVANREPVLANERALGAFKAAVAKVHYWSVLAAVLMPDHLHVIASPTVARDAKLGNFSAALKRWIRRELNAGGTGSRVVLTGCYGRMNRFMRSGSILRIIQCVLDSLNAQPIGHIELA
jgi:hypothetical protein